MHKIATRETSNRGRIIIVEDDRDIIVFLCDFLSESGYKTVGHTSGKEALKTLREEEFDLLLTDLTIPEIDGIELLQQALEMDPYLVGILMTGHDSVKAAIEARRAGAFEYVLKPFKIDELFATISRALEARELSVSYKKQR